MCLFIGTSRGAVWDSGASGAWHSVVVLESSTILKAKDGAYAPAK